MTRRYDACWCGKRKQFHSKHCADHQSRPLRGSADNRYRALKNLWIEGMSVTEIAEDVGVSHQRVSKMIRKAMAQ